MSAFYRPIPGMLASRARELWNRCDVCHWSGPMASFREWWGRDQRIDVCLNCLDQPGVEQLLRDRKLSQWPDPLSWDGPPF